VAAQYSSVDPKEGLGALGESVEVAVLDAADKCVPLIGCITENRPVGVAGVIDQNRDFYTVSVVCAP